MADSKISALTEATSTDGTEVLPVVQSATTKKLAVSKIKDYLLAVANVFTKPQTFQPDSDAQAGTFRRYSSSQTANVIEVQTEANALLASVDKGGNATFPSLTLSGNISSAAWTTNGIKLKGGTSTLTDTTSSGTVAAAYTNALGGNTISTTNAGVTITDYYSLYVNAPVQGTNVTLTNKWSLGLEGGFAAPYGKIATGTIAASTPALDISQTWNAAGTTFTGLKANWTDTASASGSLLVDLQVGGASKFKIRKDGYTTFAGNGGNMTWDYANVELVISGGSIRMPALNTSYNGVFVKLPSSCYLGWTDGASTSININAALYSDTAQTIAQRNSTNAQTFRVYRSYTDASNHSRLSLGWSSTTALIATEAAGTGARGNIAFGSAALATSATVGYLMIPSCAGTATGVPADIPTGQVAIVYDSTNKKLGVYDGGWIWTAALT